jgi:hypothetical protein
MPSTSESLRDFAPAFASAINVRPTVFDEVPAALKSTLMMSSGAKLEALAMNSIAFSTTTGESSSASEAIDVPKSVT